METDKLVQHYVEKSRLPIIEPDSRRDIIYEKQKSVLRRIPEMPFPVGRDIPLKIFYPVVPKPRLRELIDRQSSTYYPGYGLGFSQDSLVITVLLKEKNANQQNRISNAIKQLEEVIVWKNNDARNGNERLANELADFINTKKKQLESDNKLLEEIIKKVPIELRRKTESAPTIDLSIKKAFNRYTREPKD